MVFANSAYLGAMSQAERRRFSALVGLWITGQIAVAVAMAESDVPWLPWLDTGQLADRLHETQLIVPGLIFGLAAILAYRDGSLRGLLVSCLAAVLVVLQWCLGLLGMAFFMLNIWSLAPASIIHVVVVTFGGLLCCAPTLAALFASAGRRVR